MILRREFKESAVNEDEYWEKGLSPFDIVRNEFSDCDNWVVLFEESPHWYTLAAEVILNLSESSKVKVLLLPDHIPAPLTRDTPAQTRGNNWEWLKRLTIVNLRKIIWLGWGNSKPSKQIGLISQRNKNITILRPDSKFRKRSNSTSGRDSLDFKNSKLLRIVETSLGENLGTAFPYSYVSARKFGNFLDSAGFIRQFIMKALEESRPASVHIINGRTLYEQLVVHICEELKIPIFAYESDYHAETQRLNYFSKSVLNFSFIAKMVETHWKNFTQIHGQPQATLEGSRFYITWREDKNLNIFLKKFDQNISSLEDLNSLKTYVFFSSSSDELNSYFREIGTAPPDQEEIVTKLISLFSRSENLDKQLVLRIHPSMANKRGRDQLFYDQISSSTNIKVVNYDSPISSYMLLKEADVILTAGSTLTAESAFEGKPTFVFGENLWTKLGISIKLDSVESIFNHFQVDIDKARVQAIKFGLFSSTWGLEFKYVDSKQMKLLDGSGYFEVLRHIRNSIKI